MKRGEVWWAEMPEPIGSELGYRRPVLVIQTDEFNRSKINTVIGVAITSNVFLSTAPGNVRLSKRACGLERESVVNISQIVTLDKRFLTNKVGRLSPKLLQEVDEGLRLVLSL